MRQKSHRLGLDLVYLNRELNKKTVDDEFWEKQCLRLSLRGEVVYILNNILNSPDGPQF